MTGSVFVLPFIAFSSFAKAVPEGFKDIAQIPGVKIELRYVLTNNFMKKNVYGDFKVAYLHDEAFEKLKKAATQLRKQKSGYGLLVFDALRPRSIQKVLFAHVKGTPEQGYVADPEKGSVHNFGFAVDLTVIDEKGRELDMGTPYDSFTKLAQPQLEDQFLKNGELTQQQHENRLLLRRVMEDAGFKVLAHEWWHFDARPLSELKQKYHIVD